MFGEHLKEYDIGIRIGGPVARVLGNDGMSHIVEHELTEFGGQKRCYA